jgi:hypothetical protein
MSTIAARDAGLARPWTVIAAVVITVAMQIASISLFFVPGSEEAPAAAVVISIVGGLLLLVGAWGLWNLRRWGARLVFVLTLLSALASIPALFAAPSGWILASAIVGVPLSLAVLVLIAHPASRRVYR